MEAIVISGPPAVGKTTVAGIIAQRLKLKMMGGSDILRQMAGEQGYKVGGSDWWDTEEGIRFLAQRNSDPNFDKETDRRLIEIARKGDMVLTSWTLPWLMKECFAVWLNGTLESRAERMAKRDNASVEETRKTLGVRDEENYRLYKGIYGIEFGKDTKPFKMVIDTTNITADQAAQMIIDRLNK